MTDYDSMSVHELILELAEIVREAVARWQVADMNKIIAIESTLRKVVVKEASVGEIEVKVRESGDELSRPGDPYRIVTASEQFICQTWIPEGKYLLIKETP